jgi:hypothetical protein
VVCIFQSAEIALWTAIGMRVVYFNVLYAYKLGEKVDIGVKNLLR